MFFFSRKNRIAAQYKSYDNSTDNSQQLIKNNSYLSKKGTENYLDKVRFLFQREYSL